MVTWTDVLSAVSSTVAALVVIFAFIVAWHQWRLARVDREDRTRPFVVIDFDFPEGPNLIFLVVRNLGATMARDVRFSFDPDLESSIGNDDGLTAIGEWNIFARGTPSLAPGKEIRFLFDNWLERKELPDTYGVRVTYNRDEKRQYVDDQVLDLGVYRHLLSVDRKNIHHVHERLKEIGKTLKGFEASGGGLRIVTEDEVKERHAAWRNHMETIEAAATEESTKSEGAPPRS